MSTRTLSLLAEFHHSGDHEAAWRLPTAQPERISDYEYYRDLARTVERGLFDAVFFADFQAYRPSFRDQMRYGFEPTSLLAAIAADCPATGVVATASTVYNQAETLARTYATLHEQTSGRVGWNIVTAGTEASAASYGLDAIPPHAERYAKAVGYVEAVLASWERDEAGLGTSRSSRPLLVQAGASDDGRDFAARFADLVFTAAPDKEAGYQFRTDLQNRAVRHGRSIESIKVAPGFLVVVGSTEEEAQRLQEQLDDLFTEDHYFNLLRGWGITGDLSLDDTVGRLSEVAGHREGTQSRIPVLERIADSFEQPPTYRQLVHRVAGSRGHVRCTGAPEQIADVMEDWFRSGAADAFVVKFSHNPGGAEAFVDQVIPELQRRGLFRRELEESTDLHTRFGIPRPA